MKSVRVLISGRVQGVCFRAYTRERALQLGVDGFVRNLPDGRVEMVAEGTEEDVDALVEWASRGPSYARVTEIDVQEEEYTGRFTGFSVGAGYNN